MIGDLTHDTRVSRLILLNPWVHTEAGASRARLKHYYLSRLMQRSFWTKFLSGKIELSVAEQRVPPPQKQDQKQQQKPKKRQNRGSAVQLLVKSNVQLKFSALLS